MCLFRTGPAPFGTGSVSIWVRTFIRFTIHELVLRFLYFSISLTNLRVPLNSFPRSLPICNLILNRETFIIIKTLMFKRQLLFRKYFTNSIFQSIRNTNAKCPRVGLSFAFRLNEKQQKRSEL